MQTLVKNSKFVVGTGALAVALLGGCDPKDGAGGGPPQKIDRAVVAQQSASRASDIVRQTGRALTFALEEGSMLSKFGGSAGGAVLGTKNALPRPLPPPPRSTTSCSPPACR